MALLVNAGDMVEWLSRQMNRGNRRYDTAYCSLLICHICQRLIGCVVANSQRRCTKTWGTSCTSECATKVGLQLRCRGGFERTLEDDDIWVLRHEFTHFSY